MLFFAGVTKFVKTCLFRLSAWNEIWQLRRQNIFPPSNLRILGNHGNLHTLWRVIQNDRLTELIQADYFRSTTNDDKNKNKNIATFYYATRYFSQTDDHLNI